MSEETKETGKAHASVVFGGGSAIAVAGILGGLLLAVGFPWVVLVYGQGLGKVLVVVFLGLGLLLGTTVSLASAVLGLVMPRQVGGGAPQGLLRELKDWSREWRQWAEVDWKHWSEEEWKEWAERQKRGE
ncbi:MAG TPA: hypothetical protein VFR02_01760 [bacterium]|nr:hypothetical protein [bacterium]